MAELAPHLFQPGNQHGKKVKYVHGAIQRSVIQDDGAKLRKMVEAMLDLAADGDVQAASWVRDTLDGKPAQSVTVSGDDERPLVNLIRMVVVQPDNSNDINSLRTIDGEKIPSLDAEQVAGTPTPLPQSVISAEAPWCDEPPPTFSKNAE